jgi:hypothetical protein
MPSLYGRDAYGQAKKCEQLCQHPNKVTKVNLANRTHKLDPHSLIWVLRQIYYL